MSKKVKSLLRGFYELSLNLHKMHNLQTIRNRASETRPSDTENLDNFQTTQIARQ